MYYPVKPEPKRWEDFKTINLNKCDDVTLEPDDSYILGCKTDNKDCIFVRRYDQLTPQEKSLLKL
ncbi:hypothetical protein ANCCAN_12435 [Ancylostoma caninum]|uniref:Uncharacterized protein n=1 Tax=Ancylostoma caninum TaxID=29170 RepID=A0A368GB24_ANCCA|nr:hypothetical protein ANCCAN_12435 [Ancylostoma caninum]